MNCREILRERGYVIGLFAIAVAIAVGWFLLDGRVGFNLADEGYLWYGSEALLRGEVPMRDFEAYDPGRYIWTAAWSLLLGHSMVALRLSCVFFGCFGVLAGLLTIRRLSRNWLFLSSMACLLSAWMHPRYKVFEQSIALMAVYAGVLLFERPTLRRHFAVGVFGGLSAFVGRNHGVYHVFAFGLLITLMSLAAGWRTWFQRGLAWGSGLLVGYLPQILMFLFVPGFFAAYLPYLRFIVTSGTNLSKRVDWPWLVKWDAPPWALASALMEGCFYVALLVFIGLAAVRAWQTRRDWTVAHHLLLAAACVTIPYTHYVFSRADPVHLAHGAPAMLIGAIALAFTFPRVGRVLTYTLMPLAIVASLLAQLSQLGIGFECLAPKKQIIALEVNGEPMKVGLFHTRALTSAFRLVHDLAKPDEAIFFAPHTPGLYTFTGRRSPTKQLYFVFPAAPEVDQHIVDELRTANVQWAMIENYPLDGRDDLRFPKTNPLVWEYLQANFRSVPMSMLPTDMVLLHRITTPGS